MSAEDHYLKGAALAGDDEFDDAREHLEKAIELDPNLFDAYEVLGLVHMEQDALDEAKKVFESLIERDQDHMMAYVNLSRIYQRQGDIETAEEMQAKARTLSWKDEIAQQKRSTADS